MRLGLLSLFALCGVCNAAPTAVAGDDGQWLRDPVGEVLAAADTAPAPGPAPAREPEGAFSVRYLDVLWSDTKETVTQPWQWDGDDWRKFGLIGGGLVLTGAFLDKPIRDAAQSNRSTSSDNFFRDMEKFGTKQYGLPVLVGFYAYGAFADDYRSKTVALDGFSASVISALVTSTIKGLVGRARPNTGLGPHHFAPFSGNMSFPSGHATGAFAFASVIAGHYDSPWVATTAYTIASLVGVARIHLDAHWTSDVITGGLIGGLIGHHLVEFNEELRSKYPDSAPKLGTDGSQLTLSWAF